MTAAETWLVREVAGAADDLHALVPDVPARREIWHLGVTEPALVLGSTQADTVDREAASAEGITVVRRRSGGGAVLLIPGESTWVDVVVPRSDVLWDDDVTRSFLWLGDAWTRTLAECGVAVAGLEVHRGGLVRGALGAVVCFAGLGPGEVWARPDDRHGELTGKVVGLSQRRTRELARFQCTVHHTWRPDLYRRLLPDDIGGEVDVPPVASVDVNPEELLTTFGEVLTTL